MLLKDFYSVGKSLKNGPDCCTEIKINKNHILYNGHFPNRPVTPGVILMQLFKEEAERLSLQKLQLEKAVNVKFTAVVDPNEDENLKLISTIEVHPETVVLKGVGEHKNAIALRINAVYRIKK